MNGRDERDEKIIQRTKLKLVNQPEYLYEYLVACGEMSATSRETYVAQAIRFKDYLAVNGIVDVNDPYDFKRIKPTDIQQYISMVTKKADSKVTIYNKLQNFFRFMVNQGYVGDNIFSKVKKPKKDKPNDPTYLTEDEIQTIIKNLNKPWGNPQSIKNRKKFRHQNILIFYLGITTGLRRSSIAEINLEDIDFENREIKVVQKGHRIHYAYYPEILDREFDAWLKDRVKILRYTNMETNALFIDNTGKRINNSYIPRMLEWASLGLKKKVTPHKMRSTCATQLYNKSKDLYLTAQILGHSSVQTTSRYVATDLSKKKKAADILGKIVQTDIYDIAEEEDEDDGIAM